MTEFHIVSFVAIFWKSAHTSTIYTYMWYNDAERRPVNHERTGAIEESQDSELCYSHIFKLNEISFGIFSFGRVFFWNGILSAWHKNTEKWHRQIPWKSIFCRIVPSYTFFSQKFILRKFRTFIMSVEKKVQNG